MSPHVDGHVPPPPPAVPAACSSSPVLPSHAHTVPLLESHCANRVATGAAVGGALGASIGAMYGTYEAFRYKVPGLLKVRYIGQTTLSSAAVFGLFLGAGSLLHCGRQSGY